MVQLKRKQVSLLIGLILLAAGLFNPLNMLATLTIDTTPPSFSNVGSYPDSTDINAPSVITQIGSAKDFWVSVRDENGIASVNLRCKSTDLSYDSGAVNAAFSTTLAIGGVNYEVWKWAAPILAEGKVYNFAWTATDTVGNSATLTTYGGYGDADGYFIVNGVQVNSTTQKIPLKTRTIDISFTATKLAEAIQSIRVVVKTLDGTVLKDANLGKVDSTMWRTNGFYTFSADGTYTIEGSIALSTKSLRKMSIFTDIGLGGSFVWPLSPVRTLVTAVGAVLVVYGLSKKKR